MTNPYRASVVVVEQDLESLLDMLRYEGCIVTAWRETTVPGEYIVSLRSDNPFHSARWATFGLDLLPDFQKDDRDPIEVYGTPEHEAWLIEMERLEG